MHARKKCKLSTFSSAAAEPARPIKGPDETPTQRAQLSFPIQTLTYAAAVPGCNCGKGQADGGRPWKVASTVVGVCVCVFLYVHFHTHLPHRAC